MFLLNKFYFYTADPDKCSCKKCLNENLIAEVIEKDLKIIIFDLKMKNLIKDDDESIGNNNFPPEFVEGELSISYPEEIEEEMDKIKMEIFFIELEAWQQIKKIKSFSKSKLKTELEGFTLFNFTKLADEFVRKHGVVKAHIKIDEAAGIEGCVVVDKS